MDPEGVITIIAAGVGSKATEKCVYVHTLVRVFAIHVALLENYLSPQTKYQAGQTQKRIK